MHAHAVEHLAGLSSPVPDELPGPAGPPKGAPWAHNSLGASVHNALAAWWRLPRRDRSVPAAGGLLEQGWLSDGYADAAQSATYRGRSRQLVQDYVATLDPAAEPAGVERTVATRTDSIAVSGRIDRLDDRRRGGGASAELVVVDYKTGRHQPTQDDARSSLALALYAIAAGRVLRRPCRTVELHHLPTGSVLAWEHTDQTLARQLGRAEDIASECAAADQRYSDLRSAAGESGAISRELDGAFPARSGPGCGWCDFRAHCAEGSAAAPRRLPWDGLDLTAGSEQADPVLADAAFASRS